MAFPISAKDGAAAAKGKAWSEQGGVGQWEGDAAGVWEDLQSPVRMHTNGNGSCPATGPTQDCSCTLPTALSKPLL